MRIPSTLATILAFGILCGSVFISYWPAYTSDYVNFDDPGNVLQNPLLADLDSASLERMWTEPHMGHYQPLTWMSYALERTPEGFVAGRSHFINVALHAMVAIAVFACALLLFRRLAAEHRPGLDWAAAVTAALLFALHPLRVESVAWVSERRDVLSGLFFVLSVTFWVRGFRGNEGAFRRNVAWFIGLAFTGAAIAMFFVGVDRQESVLQVSRPWALCLSVACLAATIACSARAANGHPLWWALAVLCAGISLFAKAWGIVLPAVLFLLWLLLAGSSSAEVRVPFWRTARNAMASSFPFVALSVVFMALASFAQRSSQAAVLSLETHTIVERCLQALYGVAFYPWKTLVPTGLSVIYELPDEVTLQDPRFLGALLVVPVVTAAIFFVRRRIPSLWISWLLFLAMVSPVLGFLQSGPQLVADRYSYLSCLPFAFVIGALWLLSGSRQGSWRRGWWRGALVGFCLLFLALGWGTFRQVGHWKNTEALWLRAHSVEPGNGIACFALGGVWELKAAESKTLAGRTKLLESALELYEGGFEHRPKARFLAALSRVSTQLAAMAPGAGHEERAIEWLEQALTMSAEAKERQAATYKKELGLLLLKTGDAGRAIPHLRWCVKNGVGAADCVLGLAQSYRLTGQRDLARPLLNQILAADPGNVAAKKELQALRQERSSDGGSP